jgi:hypothetical protein
MAYGPKTPEIIRDCKLKAVNPPFRSVSTPRGRKDLRVVGRVNPDACARTPRLHLDISEWNARRLAKKLEKELSRDAWRRLSALATNGGSAVSQLLEHAPSEGK